MELSNGPVPDDGGDYTILAVGEAPGDEEDKQGKPFVGRSGKLLRTALESFGFPPITYTNIVRCHPPGNKIKPKYIKCCYQSLPIKSNTKMVLLFGNTPLKAVLGESGITSWNGVVVERDGVIYVPLFHPAYILRNQSATNTWLQGIEEAWNAWSSGVAPSADQEYDYEFVYSKPGIYHMCVALMASPVIAFDTEVNSLDAFDNNQRLLVMSFATADTAWAVPVDHPGDLAPLSDGALDMMCNVLESHPHIIGHNIKFDQMQCKALLDVEFDAQGDSMLASFLYESKTGLHGLKRLAGYYLGMFEYDKELKSYVAKSDKINYSQVPLDVLLPYAAKDAAATFQLEKLLYSKLTSKQQVLYDELFVPASNTIARMQCNGLAVDYYMAERYRRVYTAEMMDTVEAIDNNPMVKGYVECRHKASKKFKFNPGSWQQKAWVLYGGKYCKWAKSAEWRKDALQYSYNLKPQGFSDSGNPSTKREFLEIYKDKCPLVADLIMYGMYQKMLGTYITPTATGVYASSSDGRIRSSFGQHTVVTGRLSSSNPNLQNIPVPEKEPGTMMECLPIKNMFTHTWSNKNGEEYEYVPGIPTDWRWFDNLELDVNDGYVMSVDYSGMELRVFASLARCEAMLEIHRSGRDFHTMVGAMVSGKPYDQITKPERYRYKWTNWTMLYGGSEYTLERLYDIPLKEGKLIKEQYYTAFPEVLEFQKECVRFARKNGYIETPFGNRRPLSDIDAPEQSRRKHAEREAANTPVQGAAGLITVMALVIIDNLMLERGWHTKIVNTVHDSIVFDVYPGELLDVAGLCVDVMENVVKYGAEWMPNIDMSWLICPLNADVDVGSHYGAMEKLNLAGEVHIPF